MQQRCLFCPCIFLHFRFSPAPSASSRNSFHPFLRCLHFLAPCFASPACIASSASSRMMLVMLGVLSSMRRPPQKNTHTRFLDLFLDATGRCYKNPRKSPKPTRKSFNPYKGGPSAKPMLIVRGRRRGADALVPDCKPSGLGLRPITSGGRIYVAGAQPAAAASRGSTSQLL